MNSNNLARLEKVHPELKRRILLLAAALPNIDVEVDQGLRTAAEQQALFDQGRTKPGHRVTNAKPFQSNHNYGLAVDVDAFINGKPEWNRTDLYDQMGAEGKKLGLEWGGDWVHIIDKPHLQLPGLSINECFALYQHGGLQAVWDRATSILSTRPAV